MYGVEALAPVYIGGLGEVTLRDVLTILGYLLLVAVALVFGTGLVAGVLTLPVLRHTGYGLLPVSKAPAEGGLSVARASLYHVALGGAVTAMFLPTRVGVYVVAVTAGRGGLLPDFWGFHETDGVLLVALVAGVWLVCLGDRLGPALRRRDPDLALRSGAAFLAYLAALVPALFVVGKLLVYAVPVVG
jgi:hypothetical protein